MENTNLKKQLNQLSKVKKTPKIEKVSSRIRLEAYKISLTPTSGQSPVHKSSNHHTEESNTEAENTADENTVDENTADENTADEQEKTKEQEKNNGILIFFLFLFSYEIINRLLQEEIILIVFLQIDMLNVTCNDTWYLHAFPKN